MLALLLSAGAAQAHDARPLAVSLTERQGDVFAVQLHVPPTVDADNLPRLVWPRRCKPLNQRFGDDGSGLGESGLVHCTGGLAGETIAVRYAIYNPSLATLFRLRTRDGQQLSAVLPPEQLGWTVPAKPTMLDVAASYLRLGIGHIWGGFDHLLFVAGLVLLARTPRRILLAVTGFTLAHSVTLSLSALRLVSLPVAPVEACIALSILFLAREIALPHPDGLAARYPILVSSSFGLLHGFGFAAALGEVGLPRGELAVGLLSFNLGVEIGQIVFIAGLGALFLLAWPLIGRLPSIAPILAGRQQRIAGYGLGIMAAFWFVQRLGPLLA